ncbi:hypothetical protein P4H65_27040 [Paenibacillus chitinolyticus]|uniref:hypothetical protein n=1 Tax=Paenibacillus chitinolyticus TaxID=79263 RepID=UPI002DB92174|nr:hypothetical protein [Paenibacillus chitinolyticus]MEC0249441.1 hypothetical protein [Paenibacillus chitinolyticus]
MKKLNKALVAALLLALLSPAFQPGQANAQAAVNQNARASFDQLANNVWGFLNEYLLPILTGGNQKFPVPKPEPKPDPTPVPKPVPTPVPDSGNGKGQNNGGGQGNGNGPDKGQDKNNDKGNQAGGNGNGNGQDKGNNGNNGNGNNGNGQGNNGNNGNQGNGQGNGNNGNGNNGNGNNGSNGNGNNGNGQGNGNGGKDRDDRYDSINKETIQKLNALKSACQRDLVSYAMQFSRATTTHQKSTLYKEASERFAQCVSDFRDIVGSARNTLQDEGFSTDIINQYQREYDLQMETGRMLLDTIVK